MYRRTVQAIRCRRVRIATVMILARPMKHDCEHVLVSAPDAAFGIEFARPDAVAGAMFARGAKRPGTQFVILRVTVHSNGEWFDREFKQRAIRSALDANLHRGRTLCLTGGAEQSVPN